jgi:hypothetical protein
VCRVDARYVCATCGAPGEQHFENTCIRCSVVRAAGDLLASATGVIPGRLAGLPDALVYRGRVDSTMRWLLKPTRELCSGDRVGRVDHACAR